jgi:hypothetical protein
VPADAAIRDGVDAQAKVAEVATGQYKLSVLNTGTTIISSVVFTAGPALRIAAVTSSSLGTCTLGGTTITCAVSMNPPPCACNPGDLLEVLFSGSGDPGGSTVSLDGQKTLTLGTAPPVTTPPTTTPPPPKTTKPPAKKKVAPKCKKGQKSTKKRPCRR